MTTSEHINALSMERQRIWRRLARPRTVMRGGQFEADVRRLLQVTVELRTLWELARRHAAGADMHHVPTVNLVTFLDNWPVPDVLEPDRVKPVRDFLLQEFTPKSKPAPKPILIRNPHSVGLPELHKSRGVMLVWPKGDGAPVLRQVGQ